MAEQEVPAPALLRESGAASPEPTSFALNPDHPATTAAQDRLGVVPFVSRLVRPLLLAPKESSLVVGVYGPWGYGKSSALNFLEEALHAAAGGQTTAANVHLPQPIVVRFTPWLYGSVETLLASFFETLATTVGDQPDSADDRSQRKTTLKALGEFIAPAAKVGAMFLPIPSGVSEKVIDTVAELLSGVAKGAATVVEGGEVTFRKRKDEAARVLRNLAAQGRAQRVVVLIDDLDRAGADEILAMLKLVKLVADLPNVSYVVAMDKVRVAAALDRALDPLKGDDFLEKIVQVGIHLPPFGAEQLSRFAVDGAIEIAERAGMDAEPLAVNWAAWEIVRSSTYEVHLRNALRTPRDVVRLLNAYGFATLTADTRADVHAVDLLLLCLLQTRFPNVYAKVRANRRFLLNEERDALSWTSRDDEKSRKQADTERRRRLAEIATESGEDAAAVLAATQVADPTPVVRGLARGRRPAQLDIAFELFPHCLGEYRGGDREVARERREARICTPEHFAGYFRLDPAPGEFRLAEIDAVFATLTGSEFDLDAARELARRTGALSESLVESLGRGLGDRMAAMSRDEAAALARAVPLLAAASEGEARFPSGVTTAIAVRTMDRLSSTYVGEDTERDLAADRATGLAALLAVVEALPADEGAKFADDLSNAENRQVDLKDGERREVAGGGLRRALEHLEANRVTLADAPGREFADVIWRLRHLAASAGEASEGGRYPPLEEYVDWLLADEPSRLANVVALGARWGGDGYTVPGFSMKSPDGALSSIDQYFDVRRLLVLARAAVANGDVERTRWPKLVREFASWPDPAQGSAPAAGSEAREPAQPPAPPESSDTVPLDASETAGDGEAL